MDNSRIDILEEEILSLAPDVLERLLWDRYRLQSGYDFGLNNRVLRPWKNSIF